MRTIQQLVESVFLTIDSIMSRPRILLLHPPGGKYRKYQLDGYCSQPQKGPFRWHPMDFLAMATVYQKDAHVQILDLGDTYVADYVPPRDVDVIIGLAGVYGWPIHKIFWRKVRHNYSGRLVLAGDICRYEPHVVFSEIPGLDGIIPEVFLPPDLNAIVNRQSTVNFWNDVASIGNIPRLQRQFNWGLQPFDLWHPHKYKLPFIRTRIFASVLTQIGCPYICEYCVVGQQWPATRAYDELDEELKILKRRWGMQHLYIRDATLNSSPAHFRRVLDILASHEFTWNAFARLDGIEKWLPALKRSGCTLLQFGIDTPSKRVLVNYKKYPRIESYQRTIQAVKKAGIETVGHFVAGLDKHTSPVELARFAKSIGLDWFTVTPLMIRPGTSMWQSNFINKNLDPGVETSLRMTFAHLIFYGTSRSALRLALNWLR